MSYYRGAVRNVQVKAEEGVSVRFPAQILRPYLTHEGIVGRFVLRYGADNRFIAIEKIW